MTKICKKSLALLLALAVCVSAMVCGVVVSAETPTPTITLVADKEAPVPGDTVQITAQVADFSAVFGADIEITLPAGLAVTEDKTVAIGKDDEIHYNAEKNTLTYVGLGDSVEIAEDGSVVSFDPVGVNADGKLFAFTFVVPEDAVEGTKYAFEFSATDPEYKAVRYCGADEVEIVPTTTGITVAVASAVCTHTPASSTLIDIDEDSVNYSSVCSICDETYTREVPISGTYSGTARVARTILPENDLSLIYKFPQADYVAYTDLTLKVTKQVFEKGSSVATYETYYLTECTPGSASGQPTWDFKFSNIAAYEVVNLVDVVLYGFDADSATFVQLKTSDDYSVYEYVKNTVVKPSTSADLVTALMDLLNYAATTQVLLDRNVTDLANSAERVVINGTDYSLKATPAENYPDKDTAYTFFTNTAYPNTSYGKVMLGKSLDPQSKVNIKVKMNLDTFTGDTNQLYMTFDYRDVDGVSQQVVCTFAETLVDTDGRPYFLFDKAPIAMMDYPVDIKLCYGSPEDIERNVLTSTTYSIETYIRNQLIKTSGVSEALSNNLKTMYAYGLSNAKIAKISRYVVE